MDSTETKEQNTQILNFSVIRLTCIYIFRDYIFPDIFHSSTSIASTGSYYFLTKSIAQTFSEMFQAAFPEWYEKYSVAFAAGVWFREDPAPFLGRAIIYKLQGRLHKDHHDLGPSASFAVGNYSGGEMLFPQLGAKFVQVLPIFKKKKKIKLNIQI